MSVVLEILKHAQSQFYIKYGLKIENLLPQKEGSEYYAHTFTLSNKNGLFRIAKKTPTKTGFFVTLWKRGYDNIIAPYDSTDQIEFVIIMVSDDKNIGAFIFPKNILLKKSIFSENGKGGKRAIRVYSPWDTAASPQASKTQKWQNEFFTACEIL